MPYEPKEFEELFGTPGFSDEMLNNHFTLYQGYVANTNKLIDAIATLGEEGGFDTPEYSELNRRLGWEFNGMRLHEYYFSSFIKGGTPLDQKSNLAKELKSGFSGSMENWEKDFRALAAMRGIGWVILYFDQLTGSLFNFWINEHDSGHMAGGVPLLVMDIFEHAYMTDYGIKRAGYIDAFFAAIDWATVSTRFKHACFMK